MFTYLYIQNQLNHLQRESFQNRVKPLIGIVKIATKNELACIHGEGEEKLLKVIMEGCKVEGKPLRVVPRF